MSEQHEREPPKQGVAINWSELAFDWIDLLIMLAVGYTIAATMNALLPGVRPKSVGVVVGSASVPALVLRRLIAPRRSRLVKTRLTLLGVLSTALLMFGFAVAAAGGFRLLDDESDAVERTSDAELDLRAEHLAIAEQAAELLDVKPVDPTEVVVGGHDALVGSLEADRTPRAAKLRAELLAEAEADQVRQQHERRAKRLEGVMWWGVVGALAIALGGFVDARRPRVAITAP